jgi:hypothetical protein
MVQYDTITEALEALKTRGYVIDFNLGFNGSASEAESKYKIIEVHRFEGNTDPDDEAVVYAIESNDGRKGFFVNGYGVSSDPIFDDMIKSIDIRR